MFTGKDRVVAAVKGQCADRLPVTVMFGAYAANFADCTIPEFLTDAKKNALSHIRACEFFHPDTITLATDIYLEAESLGAKVEFPEDGTGHLVSYVLEEKAMLGNLTIPEPLKNNRLSYYLEACEQAAPAIKDTSITGSTNGPWTLATELRGVERLIMDTRKDPDFVHKLMEFTTEYVKMWATEIRKNGIGIGMGEASASCSIISPKIYQTFIKPYHQHIVEYFKQSRLYIGMHICGYIDPIMEDILDTGIGMLSIDSPSSLRRMKELSGGRIVIMGNVPTGLFVNGTEEQMESAVRECIDSASEGGRYILSSGCEIPLNSRIEAIHFFLKAVTKYGACS